MGGEQENAHSPQPKAHSKKHLGNRSKSLVISGAFPFLTPLFGFAVFAFLLHPPAANRGAGLGGNSMFGRLQRFDYHYL